MSDTMFERNRKAIEWEIAYGVRHPIRSSATPAPPASARRRIHWPTVYVAVLCGVVVQGISSVIVTLLIANR